MTSSVRSASHRSHPLRLARLASNPLPTTLVATRLTTFPSWPSFALVTPGSSPAENTRGAQDSSADASNARHLEIHVGLRRTHLTRRHTAPLVWAISPLDGDIAVYGFDRDSFVRSIVYLFVPDRTLFIPQLPLLTWPFPIPSYVAASLPRRPCAHHHTLRFDSVDSLSFWTPTAPCPCRHATGIAFSSLFSLFPSNCV